LIKNFRKGAEYMPNTIPEFVWWVFVSVVGLCGFLGVFVLTKIDRNQTELFNRINNMEGRLSKLEGAHYAIHGGTK
jgi:hypothetical protein